MLKICNHRSYQKSTSVLPVSQSKLRLWSCLTTFVLPDQVVGLQGSYESRTRFHRLSTGLCAWVWLRKPRESRASRYGFPHRGNGRVFALRQAELCLQKTASHVPGSRRLPERFNSSSRDSSFRATRECRRPWKSHWYNPFSGGCRRRGRSGIRRRSRGSVPFWDREHELRHPAQ